MNILFQLLGISGLVILFYGLLAIAITQATTTFFWALMVLGLLGLGAFIVAWLKLAAQKPTMFRDLFQSKTVQSGAGSMLYTVIFVAGVVVVNILSYRFYHLKKDLTADKIHTLSEQTVKKLEGLKEPLVLMAFMDDRNPNKRSFEELAKRYGDYSKFVELRFVDADKERLKSEEMGAKDGDVFIEYKGQTNQVFELTESGITQAIMKVSRGAQKKLCFTTGHGELNIDGEADDPRSASALKQGLSADGFALEALALQGEVPSICDIVVVAGPDQPFTAQESAALDAFLSRGGRALFLLDPVIPSVTITKGPLSIKDLGLETLLASWGVGLGKNIVLEKQLQLFAGMQITPMVRAARYGEHPSVEPLKNGRQTVFDRARSVSALSSFSGTSVVLIYTADQGASFAQADINAAFREQTVRASAADIQGPVPLAVVAEKSLDKDDVNKKAQVVVVGDSDFASNGMIQSHEYNFDLVLNLINFLGGEEEQISIRPKAIRASAIELTPEQSNTIFYVAIIMLPMLVLLFGLNLWWYRKQKA